jgi:DNA topoisomerase-1
MTARKVMQVAQQLYEGVDLGQEGTVGLITYMRTDSTRIASEAVVACREYISAKFGMKHVPRKPNVYPQKKSAQGAHEAIRPTSMNYEPASVKEHLTRDQYSLYSLIWNRFVACQMRPAIYANTQVRIKAKPAGEGRVYELRVTGSSLKYPGWLAVEEDKPRRKKKEPEEDAQGTRQIPDDGLKVEALPALEKGDPLKLHEPGVEADQKFTKPPPRYSEGSLIKELEDRGIGRPSTYASIISTIQDRRYVKKYQQRFMPSPLGEIVIDRLQAHFPDVLDIDFTARMEEKLDAIEAGKVEWSSLLKDFYGPFHDTVLEAMRSMKSGVDSQEYEKFSSRAAGPAQRIDVDLTCGKCGKPMVLRSGRYGEFLSCSGFPKCRESMPVHSGIACPVEGCSGTIAERRTKRGRKFYGCSKYDETSCEFVTWAKPVKKKCPTCGADFLTIKRSKGATFLNCIVETCDYSEEIAL